MPSTDLVDTSPVYLHIPSLYVYIYAPSIGRFLLTGAGWGAGE